MSDQSRRRLRSNPPPRRVGEPNVLSDQATPNRLSTSTTSASAPPAPSAPVPVRPTTARPTIATGRPAQAPTDDDAPRRRVPSLSTLIFIGFLVFTAARFLSSMGAGGAGGADPTTAPRPTTPPGTPAVPGEVGVVSFGTALGDDCALEGPADSFSLKAAVWWRADLEAVQSADADAIVLTFRDGIQIDREFVPAEPEFGEWSVLCGGAPTKGALSGTYRVEVWNGGRTVLLAAGEFTRLQ